MKNYITKNLLLSLIAAVTISGNLIAMNGNENWINLKLNQKPLNKSCYEFCKERANKIVKESTQEILKILLKNNQELENEQEWKNIKEGFRIEDQELSINNIGMINTGSFTEKEKTIILNVINHPDVKKELDIKKISQENNMIIAHRGVGKKEIKFLRNSEAGLAASDGQNVIIAPNLVNCKKYSDSALEAIIGHELGHIKYEHVREIRYILKLYKIKIENGILIDEFEFLSAMSKFYRAIELQADITATFNRLVWIKGFQDFFDTETAKLVFFNINPNSCEVDIEHPSIASRADYLHQFSCEIQKEMQNKIESNKKPQVIINKKPAPQVPANRPTVNVNKPAPVKKETIIVKPLRPTTRPQMPANKPVKPVPIKQQPVVDKKPTIVNKPVIVTKPAPVNTKVNKVSEMAKKFDKFFQEQKKQK